MPNPNAVLVNHPGPLPISFQYTPQADVPETIWFSGSMHTGNLAEGTIGFALKVNGETVGQSTIYTNDQNGPHSATVPVMVNYDIPFVIPDPTKPVVQPVTIELVPIDSDSLSSKEDRFNVAIFS